MYSFYKISLVTILLAACSGLTSAALTAEPRSTPQPGENNSVVLPTDANGILAQCGDYFTFNPAESAYGVVPQEYNKDFIPVPSMIVPVYGYMVDREFNTEEALNLPQGENPYTAAEINRAMWDRHTFIWMSPTIEPETFTYIKTYAEKWNSVNEEKIIPLTWKDKKTLPLNREFAFSSWNISQSCQSFSEGVFEDFLKHAKEHNGGKTEGPVPVAVLTETGELPK